VIDGPSDPHNQSAILEPVSRVSVDHSIFPPDLHMHNPLGGQVHALEDVSLFRSSTIRALCMLGTADAVDALNVNSHTQNSGT
jgi:hypothetical protein